MRATTCALLALAARAAADPPCATLPSTDCMGGDIDKINNASMTPEQCCALCRAHPSCDVAVVATDHNPVQCLLKTKACATQPGGNRIKCCATPAAGSCTTPAPTPPFRCPAAAPHAFCDVSLPVADRARALVASLTAAEKVAQVGSNGVPAIPRLGIPSYQWWGEALHGVCESPSVSFRQPTPNGTSFPEPILTAASFDAELFHLAGRVVGKEARVMMNVGNAGGTFWAPNVNLVKDPRWGRLQETPGEDPFLTATYAIQYVTGIQGDNPRYLQASSCCKHAAAYSEENWGGVTRYEFDAHVSPQEWAESYSVPFWACVVGANVSGIMCSYNAMNGVPTCASTDLLTTLMRNEWKFDGYVTGDCGAAGDVWDPHHYGKTKAESAADTVKAGMDVDCGNFLQQNLGDAVQGGQLSEAELDEAVVHLFSVRLRLGDFDGDANPYAALRPGDVDVAAHQAAALRAARQGIVLLENKGGALPLSNATVSRVAVIGPNSNRGGVMQGVDCHGVPPYLITPADGLAAFVSNVTQADGCDISSNSTDGFPRALAAASAADATVMVMGLDASLEYEMRDRTTLLLPPTQSRLVHAAAAAAAARGKPAVLVLMCGGVIDTTEFANDPNVSAIVWVGYPGQSGGQALAEILFGAVAPSGRTPLTWYREDYLTSTNLSMWDMGFRPNASSTVKQGRTYRFFTSEPVYPFGFGLFFTQFDVAPTSAVASSSSSSSLAAYSAAAAAADSAAAAVASSDSAASKLSATVSSADIAAVLAQGPRARYSTKPLATVAVRVANVGRVASTVSVLAFVSPPGAGAGGRPLRSLAAFDVAHDLAPGASAIMSFGLDAYALSLVGSDGTYAPARGTWTVSFSDTNKTAAVVVT